MIVNLCRYLRTPRQCERPWTDSKWCTNTGQAYWRCQWYVRWPSHVACSCPAWHSKYCSHTHALFFFFYQYRQTIESKMLKEAMKKASTNQKLGLFSLQRYLICNLLAQHYLSAWQKCMFTDCSWTECTSSLTSRLPFPWSSFGTTARRRSGVSKTLQ
jgi:hypothetical protein